MNNTRFNDRAEKKYQIGISESEVADLCRDMSSFLEPYGLSPVQEITSVGSIYYDNKDCDLLRYSLFGRLMLVRLRAYELFYHPIEPITDYWVEVKTAEAERRTKRRFRLPKSALAEFFEGRDAQQAILDYNRCDADEDVIRPLYREAQEMILTLGLQPVLLVVYKRIAFQSEVARLSVDWDLQYYNVSTNAYNYSSWKYLDQAAAGKSDNVILEIKYLQREIPPWFCQLQRNYPIRQREYLKPVEGMGFLFQGPLKYHKEANFFLPLIAAYLKNSQLG
jgi:SPX domain protein involved in polyphosphate accumulation